MIEYGFSGAAGLSSKTGMVRAVAVAVLTMTTLTFTACDKEDTPEKDGYILFSASVENVSQKSRASSITGTSLPSSGSYGVLGYVCTTGNWTGNETAEYMYNTEIRNNGGYADSGDMRYWPPTAMKFFAYYPYQNQAASGKTITLPPASTTGMPYIDYTVQKNQAEQIDLLAASTTAVTRLASVPLRFGHLLTRIGFTCKISNQIDKLVIFKRLALIGVARTGRYSFAGGGSWGSWTNISDTLTIFNGNKIINTSSVQITDPADGYSLLLPQPLTDISVEVEFVIENTIIVTNIIELSSTEATNPWTTGKALTYGLNINTDSARLGEITFDITSPEWNDVSINRIPGV